MPWSTAKLEAPSGEGLYVEYFRGKDFARYFRANPEKLNAHMPLKPGKYFSLNPIGVCVYMLVANMITDATGKTVDDQIGELITLFMKRKLVRKTDRKYKKPKPGKKRLVKFPRTLVPHPVRPGVERVTACSLVRMQP